MDAIRLDRLTVKRGGVVILEQVSATVPLGGVTAIIGPNGAGKTTLLFAVLRLVPYQGQITFVRRDGGARKPRIGYVPQRLDFDRGIPITVIDFLVMSRHRRPLWLGAGKTARTEALAALKQVHADHLLDRPIGNLSGGELQRVQLALALEHEPEILLLDEPVSGVDVAGEQLFCDMLERLRKQARLTIVMVSHDLSVVSQHATHVICLNRRVQCEGPAPVVLTKENLEAIYGPHSGLYEHHGPGTLGHAHCGD